MKILPIVINTTVLAWAISQIAIHLHEPWRVLFYCLWIGLSVGHLSKAVTNQAKAE